MHQDAVADTFPSHLEIGSKCEGSIPEELNITPITIETKLSVGGQISVTIEGGRGSTASGLYSLKKSSGDSYIATINLRNPIFDRFEKSLSPAEGQEQLAYVIKVMVAVEISLSQGGGDTISGAYFRHEFNKLFGAI